MLEMANFKLFSRSFRKTYPRQKRAPNEHDDRTGVVSTNEKLTASSPPSPSSSSSSSYRVTLFGCSRFEPREILKILAQNLNYEVVFYHAQKERNNVVCYVEGDEAAVALRGLSRKTKNPNGQLITIMVAKAPIPQSTIDQTLIELINRAVCGRYNPETNVLDLSNFNNSGELQQKGVYVSISRCNILKVIMRFIVHKMSNLVALKLSNNRLTSLEPLAILHHKCPNLRGLDLSRNLLSKMTELEHLRGLNLVELHLHHNPIDKIKSQDIGIRYLHNICKSLKSLDGVDISDRNIVTLPVSLGSHFPDESVKALVFQFFEEFYQIYDSGDRSSLVEAYHDHAIFTYVNHSSNPNMARSYPEASILVKTNNKAIVEQFEHMPKSKHASESMKFDVPLFTSNLMQVIISGELQQDHQGVKVGGHFVRTFNLIPYGSGCVIVNDMHFFQHN